MRNQLVFLSLGAAVLLGLAACHQQKATAPAAALASSPKPAAAPRFVRFGSGGGFAGTTTTYTLYTDGRLERYLGSPADTSKSRTGKPLKTPPAAAVAKAFEAFDALSADSLSFRQPGNMYYFLEGQTKAGRHADLVWGAPGASVSHGVRALYRQLIGLVPLAD